MIVTDRDTIALTAVQSLTCGICIIIAMSHDSIATH